MKELIIPFQEPEFLERNHRNIIRNFEAIVQKYEADHMKKTQEAFTRNCNIEKHLDRQARVAEIAMSYELSNSTQKTSFHFHVKNNTLIYQRIDF